MKAIILERRRNEAAVLCEDGTFAKTRARGEIGETIELSAEVVALPARKKRRWMRSAVAAALALAITGGTLGYMSGTANAYVTLDVEESSIELAVNHFGRVIAVNALSEDARELAASLSGEVRYRRVGDALDHTMERLRDGGYLNEGRTTVVAGVATDSEKCAAELKQLVEHSVKRDGENTAYVSEANRAEREQARERQISVGRFGLERDRRELPGTAEDENEALREESTEPGAPAISADNTDSSVTAGTQTVPAEQPGREPPQDGGQSSSVPPQDDERGGEREQPPGGKPIGAEPPSTKKHR